MSRLRLRSLHRSSFVQTASSDREVGADPPTASLIFADGIIFSDFGGRLGAPHLRFDERHQQALLDCARRGSTAARETLLAIQRRWILLWFARELPACLRSKVDPDDLVQEVSFHAWRRFDQFVGDSLAEYRSWLGESCRNCLLFRLEHYTTARCREVAREVPLSERAIASGKQRPFHRHWSGEAGTTAGVETAEELERLLAGLSARRKEVVILHALEERTLPEIAQCVGCSLRTVERDWATARTAIRRRLLERELVA